MDNRADIREFLASRRAKITSAERGTPESDALRLLASWALDAAPSVDRSVKGP